MKEEEGVLVVRSTGHPPGAFHLTNKGSNMMVGLEVQVRSCKTLADRSSSVGIQDQSNYLAEILSRLVVDLVPVVRNSRRSINRMKPSLIAIGCPTVTDIARLSCRLDLQEVS